MEKNKVGQKLSREDLPPEIQERLSLADEGMKAAKAGAHPVQDNPYRDDPQKGSWWLGGFICWNQNKVFRFVDRAQKNKWLYTVFWSPTDYPGQWIVRAFQVPPAQPQTTYRQEPTYVGLSYEDAVAAIQAEDPETILLGRDYEDHPSLREVWG